MFSNTAYEALYKYLGLMFHAGSIQVITSEALFKGLLLIIFGFLFLTGAWKISSRHMFGNIVKKHNLPLSYFFKITLCLVLGISVLRIGSDSEVRNYGGKNWSQNKYVKKRFSDVSQSYKVSLIFDLLTQTSEEVGQFATKFADFVFGDAETSFLKGPHGYAKAIMLAGSATIEDPALQNKVKSYTQNCILRVLPSVKKMNKEHINFAGMYNGNTWINSILEKVDLTTDGSGGSFTCRDLKDEVRSGLMAQASKIGQLPGGFITDPQKIVTIKNIAASNMINNFNKDNREGLWGIQKGSNLPTNTGTGFQYLNKLRSWDTFLSLTGNSDKHGSAEASRRAQKFSEMLARAPHIKGIIQMILIGIFPWLVFFLVAGKWKIILGWFWLYLSVCMWTPIWTIFYHIMNRLNETANMLSAYGSLSDGISMYSANLVLDKIYFSYSVFTLAQTLVPIVTTGLVVYFMKPIFANDDSDQAPEFVDDAKSSVQTSASLAAKVM